MSTLSFDYSNTAKFIKTHELEYLQPFVTVADKRLREGTGQGADFTDCLLYTSPSPRDS